MNANFYSSKAINLHASLCVLTIFLSVIFSINKGVAQNSRSYPSEPIDAAIEDTVKVSLCGFPYKITNTPPYPGETATWRVIDGIGKIDTVNVPDLMLEDILGNSITLRYTITDTNNVTHLVDHLLLIKDSTHCSIIERANSSNPGCGDTITLKSRLSTGYTQMWYVNGNGQLLTDPTSGDIKVKLLGPGTVTVGIFALSPAGFNTLNDQVTYSINCDTPTVTQANAGSNIELAPCLFPYTLSGNVPAPGETVKWEVVSGTAMLSDEASPNAIILDATNGTLLKYTITNGIHTSSDTVAVNFIPWLVESSCNPTVSNQYLKCGEDVSVYFYFHTNGFQPYTFEWDYTGLTPNYINISSGSFKANHPGTYFINVTVKSPYWLNTFTKTIPLEVSCSSLTQANAGPDTTVFCSTTLNANFPGPNEQGEWKLVYGMADILQINNPNTPVVNIISDSLILVWTITNGSEYSYDTLKLKVDRFKIMYPNYKSKICEVEDGSVQVAPLYGRAPYSIVWENGSQEWTRSGLGAGSYAFTVRDQSGCELIDSVIISDTCHTGRLYSVEGNVWAETGLYNYGLALLIKYIDNVPVPVNSVHVSNGYYKFTGVEKGAYIVYVLPYTDSLLTNLDSYYLPTYYVNKVDIATANPIQVNGNTFSVDIKLAVRSHQNAGMNSVQGYFNTLTALPISSLPVLLFNTRNELVDANFFEASTVNFNNLASGEYYLLIPLEGIGYKATSLFEVHSSSTIIDLENVGSVITGTKHPDMNSFKAYPNPFSEVLTIETGQVDYNSKAIIIDAISAKEIKEYPLTSGPNRLNTEALAPGSYIVQIINGTTVNYLFIIKH